MPQSPHHHQRGLSGSGYFPCYREVGRPITTHHISRYHLDTQRMEAQLPSDKLLHIRNQLSAWLTRKKATKREILSLVGLLQHARKVVRPGRSFVSRMYITAAKLKQLYHYTHLNKDFRSDLHWWNAFISIWSGTSFLQAPFHQTILITPSKLMP